MEKRQKTSLAAKYKALSKKEKTSLWVKVGVYVILIAFLVVFLLSKQIFGPDSLLGSLFASADNGFEGIGLWFADHGKAFIMTAVIIVSSYIIYHFLKFLLKLITSHGKKAKTVGSLLISILKYALIISSIFLCLTQWGVDTSTLLASLGILTLVIGLGCQSLISDVVSGLFLITESSFEVGDIVVVDSFRGTVYEVGLRSTKILDAAGNLKVINNSDIHTLVNLSKALSVAVVDTIEIPYEVPLEKAEAIFADHLGEIKEKIPAIVEGPFYKGVTGYESDAGIGIKFVAKCSEEDRYQVERDLNRDIYLMMLKYGIDIPYTHVLVGSFDNSSAPDTASKKEEKKAADFVGEQKASSSGLEEQHK